MGKTEKIAYILERLKENLTDNSIEKDATFMVYFCEEMMEIIDYLLGLNLGHLIDMQLFKLFESFKDSKEAFETIAKIRGD